MNLQTAVLNRAREDYISGIPRHDIHHVRVSIRKWLNSDAGALWIGDIGPQTIVDNWNKQAEHETWRIQMKCKSCRNKECVHYDPGHYTKKRECKGFVTKKNDKKN